MALENSQFHLRTPKRVEVANTDPTGYGEIFGYRGGPIRRREQLLAKSIIFRENFQRFVRFTPLETSQVWVVYRFSVSKRMPRRGKDEKLRFTWSRTFIWYHGTKRCALKCSLLLCYFRA